MQENEMSLELTDQELEEIIGGLMSVRKGQAQVVDPFGDRQARFLQAFAAQGGSAIVGQDAGKTLFVVPKLTVREEAMK